MDDWKHKMTCLTECPRCHKPLHSHDSRILSCYDNEPICMDGKKMKKLVLIMKRRQRK